MIYMMRFITTSKRPFQGNLSHLHYSSASVFSITLMKYVKKDTFRYYQSPSLLYVQSVQKILMILIRFYIYPKPRVLSPKRLIDGSREIPFHYLRASAGFYSRSLVLQDITMIRYFKRFITI